MSALGCPGMCPGAVCLGCLPRAGVYPEGVCLGVVCPGGVHPQRQTPPAYCMLGYTPPVNRMTDKCKTITLPQTSFVGGKNISVNGLCYRTTNLKSCEKVYPHQRRLAVLNLANS